jgi:calcium-translocating P-type ATPase
LVEYDEDRFDVEALLARAATKSSSSQRADRGQIDDEAPARLVSDKEVAELLGSERVSRERSGIFTRARVAVRGLDRDGELPRRLVGALRKRPGVSGVSVSRLTGRVLIEFDAHQVDIEELIALVARMELPDLPGEDCPTHPLDVTPLIQSAARTTGAALGLGLLAVRRLAGAEGPPTSSSAPVAVAAAIGILEGLPPLRRGVRQVLGRDRAQLALGALHVISLTFAGSPLGLAVSGAGALRLLTEVHARRTAWKRYEERLGGTAEAIPGQTVRVSAGERCPLPGTVREGDGTMIGRDGLPHVLAPGDVIPAGARVYGGPFVVELRADRGFEPYERPVGPPATSLDRYLALLSPVALGYAVLSGVLTRSPTRMLSALLLVNARPALIGADAADAAASARVLRSGVTIVGRRDGRIVRLPGVLLIDGPRVLTQRRLQIGKVVSLRSDLGEAEILSIASGIAAASGSPWGPAFPPSGHAAAQQAAFEGGTAAALVGGSRMRLVEAEMTGEILDAQPLRGVGHQLLVLRREGESRPLGMVALRPRLAEGALRLLEACRERGVAVEVLAANSAAVRHLVGDHAPVTVTEAPAVEAVRERQRAGQLVAVLSDSPHAAPALAAADLGIALTSGLSGRFAARADLLAPDLDAVGAIVQAASRRRAAVDDAIALSVLSNVVGAFLGLRTTVGLERGSEPTYVAALAAIGMATVRLAGGRASGTATRRFADPEPERWGRPSLTEVFRQLASSPPGLSEAEARQRVTGRQEIRPENPILAALGDQLRSPLNGALAAGAAISLGFGAVADVVLIGAVIVANTGIGVWQEHQAVRASEVLARDASGKVSVRRGGSLSEVNADELVVGDVIVLGSGDRVPADARLFESDSLEVDEAALTGESLPVTKDVADQDDAGRVLLEGSDVTVGTAQAVVFAVGDATRFGATKAALARVEAGHGVLDQRLSRLVRQSAPVIAGGAGLIALSGALWRRPLASQLALAASIATAVVPEGLPLLAGVSEAAVARRLAGRNALVRRLSAVEALGRVDVACADKTGTLTAGRLELTAVETSLADRAPTTSERQEVLLAAALASPHPDAEDAGSHPTDLAVIAAAEDAGLSREIRLPRTTEVPFAPARAFHATQADSRLTVKGAAEALVERCVAVRRHGRDAALADGEPRELLEQAERLAGRGLRVLMVAEGPAEGSAEDPQNLVALGLIGISDPLREGVPAAVARCQQAGVRVIMLTGDHPATAQAIAAQAGLEVSPHRLMTGTEISGLDDADLDRRLRDVSVVARITPLDKLRIVERLQGQGHTVAMTGDGVNDAPALRLADVGVSMGLHGTEVARQASDVVLVRDDFATLVETLVEGRSFWRNLRRSLGLLMGGNLGELGMMVGASVLGLAPPLTTRQILAVNLVTDVLPALAVAAQQPEHRDLAALRREGGKDQDSILRADVLRRGWATAGPALVGYALATRLGSPAQARSVAFGGIVATQLGQALSLGRSEGSLTRPVLAAIAGSGGFALAAMVLPPLSGFLGLALPSPAGFGLVAMATIGSIALATPREETGRPEPALGLIASTPILS